MRRARSRRLPAPAARRFQDDRHADRDEDQRPQVRQPRPLRPVPPRKPVEEKQHAEDDQDRPRDHAAPARIRGHPPDSLHRALAGLAHLLHQAIGGSRPRSACGRRGSGGLDDPVIARHDDPPDDVRHNTEPVQEGERDEHDPRQHRVDAEVVRESGRHAAQNGVLRVPCQPSIHPSHLRRARVCPATGAATGRRICQSRARGSPGLGRPARSGAPPSRRSPRRRLSAMLCPMKRPLPLTLALAALPFPLLIPGAVRFVGGAGAYRGILLWGLPPAAALIAAALTYPWRRGFLFGGSPATLWRLAPWCCAALVVDYGFLGIGHLLGWITFTYGDQGLSGHPFRAMSWGLPLCLALGIFGWEWTLRRTLYVSWAPHLSRPAALFVSCAVGVALAAPSVVPGLMVPDAWYVAEAARAPSSRAAATPS